MSALAPDSGSRCAIRKYAAHRDRTRAPAAPGRPASAQSERTMHVSVPSEVLPVLPASTSAAEGTLQERMARDGATARWNADQAVTRIYREHYRSLVRLASLLVADTGTA